MVGSAGGPFVSVVVPVKDDDGALGVLLQSLRYQSYPRKRFEVIVVHNNPEPLDINVPTGLSVTSLAEPADGSYAARNRGIEQAAGEILAFTDSDCVAHPDWLWRAVNSLSRDRDRIVGGEIQVFASHARPNLAEKHQLAFAFDQDINLARRRGLPTANLIVSSEVMNHVGWFNPKMLSGGDAEWSRRALRHGYRWHVQRDAVVYHPARSSFRQLRAQRARFATAIHTQPTGLRRIDWYLSWISPRQGLMGRLRHRIGLRKRDWPVLVMAQLALAMFQVGIGLVEILKTDKLPSHGLDMHDRPRPATSQVAE